MAAVRRIWAVLLSSFVSLFRFSFCHCYPVRKIGQYSQDRINLSDELHTDGKGRLRDGTTELLALAYSLIP